MPPPRGCSLTTYLNNMSKEKYIRTLHIRNFVIHFFVGSIHVYDYRLKKKKHTHQNSLMSIQTKKLNHGKVKRVMQCDFGRVCRFYAPLWSLSVRLVGNHKRVYRHCYIISIPTIMILTHT